MSRPPREPRASDGSDDAAAPGAADHGGRFRRARSIFLAALDRPAAERAEWVRSACGDDAALLAEVRSLLDSDKSGEIALDSPALDRGLLAGAAADAPLPARIGPYRVIRRIGSGGMGTIFEAEQSAPQRRVAVKVMSFLAEGTALRRFVAETEFLGRLSHPNIARIYAAGAEDADGRSRPYFAMELVEGIPLDAWVRTRHPSLDARLRLLRKVCGAVQHAHQRGIIHRDLKPANILVEADGEPKLLDFGVAKGVDPEGSGGPVAPAPVATFATSPGALVGTLLSMSPEQLEGDPRDVDVRTDVYALGVIAWQLLAGRPFIDLSGTSFPEAVRRLRVEEPPRLGSIDPSFRGDLETIVAKAMRKEKDARYDSASALAADIDRHLADEPILARPPAMLYQLRKFARRNRALVLATAAIIVILAATTAVSTVQWRRADRSEGLAREEAGLARAALDFLVGLFEAEDPYREGATEEPPSTAELLDRGTERVGRELGGQPRLRRELLLSLGRIHRALGDAERARPLLEEAVALHAPQGPDRADPEGSIDARVELGSLLGDAGETTRSVELLEGALVDALALDDGPRAAEARIALAEERHRLGRYPAAEEEYAAVLSWLDDADSPAGLALRARALGGRTRNDIARSELDRAVESGRASVAAAIAVHGEDHPAIRRSLVDLGSAHLRRHDLVEAETATRRVVDLDRKWLAEDHPARLQALAQLADLLDLGGRAEEAEPYYEELVWHAETILASEHPQAPAVLAAMFDHALGAGASVRAEEYAARALAVYRSYYGDDNPGIVPYLVRAARAAAAGSDPVRAEQSARHAEARAAALLPESDSERIYATGHLGRTLLGLGKLDEAEPWLRRALELRRVHLGRAHRHLPAAILDLARFERARKRYPEAEALFREAIGLLREHGGGKGKDLADALAHLAHVLINDGRLEEAEALLDESIAATEGVLPDDHPSRLLVRYSLAQVLYRRGSHARAEAEWRSILTLAIVTMGDLHPNVLQTRKNIAMARRDSGDLAGGQALYEEVLALLEQVPGPRELRGEVLGALAGIALGRGDPALAEERGRAAVAEYDTLGGLHPASAVARHELGALLIDRGNPQDAEEPLRAAAEIHRRIGEPAALARAAVEVDLGRALALLGRDAEAEALLEAAWRLLEERAAPDDPRRERARAAWAAFLEARGRAAEAAALRGGAPSE